MKTLMKLNQWEVEVSRTRVLDDAQKSEISDTQETGGVLAWQ